MKRSTNRLVTSLLCLLCVVLMGLISSCGYQLKSNKRAQGTDIQSVAIPMIKSTSSFPGFEAAFTRMIREEFVSHTKVPLVARYEAQTVLMGEVIEIETKALSYDVFEVGNQDSDIEYEITRSRRLVVELDMMLMDRISGNIIWKHKGMKEKALYEVSGDPLADRYNKREALRKVARNFARRVFQKTIERF